MKNFFRSIARGLPRSVPGKFFDDGCERVAVIIPCHNYGQYLGRAIESVLGQTLKPAEILVVDDASTDNTADIAASYADRGVSYMRVEHRDLASTRNSAAAATCSPFFMYLDADDYLDATYLQRCREQFTDHSIAIVYGGFHEFNERNIKRVNPPFDYDRFMRVNYIGSHAMIRRQAYDLVGGYRIIPKLMEDWDFYMRVFAAGFTARKADTYLHYNIHSDSLFQTHIRSADHTYLNDAALLHHPITIFTSFKEKQEKLDAYLARLRAIAIDPSIIHLFWYNMSDDEALNRRLRQECSSLPFGSVRYMHDPLPAIWGTGEYHDQLAAMRAYNVMINESGTEYAFALNADMMIQPDTLASLLNAMHADCVAVVAPSKNVKYPHYNVWNRNSDGGVAYRTECASGIEKIDGCGFDCTLFRMSGLRAIAPLETSDDHDFLMQGYAQIACRRLADHGVILCDWNCIVTEEKNEPIAEQMTADFN